VGELGEGGLGKEERGGEGLDTREGGSSARRRLGFMSLPSSFVFWQEGGKEERERRRNTTAASSAMTLASDLAGAVEDWDSSVENKDDYTRSISTEAEARDGREGRVAVEQTVFG